MKKIMIGLAVLIAMSVSGVHAQDRGHRGGGGGARGGFERSGWGGGRRGGFALGGRGEGFESGQETERSNFGGGRPGYGGYPRPAYGGGYPPGIGYGGMGPRGGGTRGFTRGQFLPPAYLGGIIADPRQYHLRRPPTGYGWVTIGPNAYLTQRSTGLILDTAPLY
jgi:Ni/Co efflux regulator RcnB